MKFEHPDYPDTFSIKIVEVHYKNGDPSSWHEPYLACVEDLDVPEGSDEATIKNAFAMKFLKTQTLMSEAFNYPILNEIEDASK